MKTVQNIGVTIVSLVLIFWISLLFTNSFELTEEIFNEKVKTEHQELLRPRLEPMFGEKYTTVFPFSQNILNEISMINTEFDKTQEYDKKIYDKYELSLSKSSAIGWLASNSWYVFLLTLLLRKELYFTITLIIYVIFSCLMYWIIQL